MSINWNISRTDEPLIESIVARAIRKLGGDPLNLRMSITACHLNGNALHLSRLLEADDFNFFHDICGICRHINTTDGSLNDHYVPRFSKPTAKVQRTLRERHARRMAGRS